MNISQLVFNICFIIKNFFSIIFLKREKQIANILIKNKLTLSTAESCTGGLISSRMTDISGSSAYILQNLTTYSNKSKIILLDVKSETIEKYGVVSEQVALEMALGLLKKYNCEIAISTTGIAGPTGATATKPVGLCCMAIANSKTNKTYQYKANSLLYRRIMKYAFSNKALDYLIEFLKKNY